MIILENWWVLPLILYGAMNVFWIFAMIIGRIQGYGFAETPSEMAELFNINLFGGIILFIFSIILFPLWSLLFWTYKLFYFLFHVGLKN